MIFNGTQQECAEVIAELDAAHGYPRGYTEADVTAGLVVRHGRGPHAPIESIRTETIATPAPVVADADGQPLTAERVVRLRGLRDEHRREVAKRRVLRLLNRGSRAALMAVPGIGGTRANAIIARRAQGRMTSIEDVRAALGPAAMQALRDYALTRVGDDDQDEAT